MLIEKKENPLLNRTEYAFSLEFEGATPSYEKVFEAVLEQIKTEPDCTLLKSILTMFGAQKARVIVYVYSDKETMRRLEKKALRRLKAVLEKQAESKEEKTEKEKVEAEAEEAKKAEEKESKNHGKEKESEEEA